MQIDREETFRKYLDKIIDAMNVSSIDYDIENDTCKSEGACADVGINRKVRINKCSKYEK